MAIWFLIGMIMTLAIGGSAVRPIEVGLETLIVAAIVRVGLASADSRPSLLVLIAYEAVSIVFNADVP